MDKLALHGGKPVRDKLLPYGSQSIDDADIQAVVAALQSDYLTQGPKIAEFERAVAAAAGTEYAVAFCNGTAALHAACFAAGIGPGDEVITSPLTFAASSNCVLYVGGTPVFADVDANTYLLDLNEVEKKLTPRTKALIPVDFTGQPVHMQQYKTFCQQHGLILIQDAAHSLGGAYDGSPVGSIADMTMFSFHPVKPVTTGEGGVIVTHNRHYYERLMMFRTHGITRNADQFVHESEGPWYYEMQELGYNYRITDLQAALGLSQMHRLSAFIDKRNELASLYDKLLEPIEVEGWARLPRVREDARSGWHLYILELQLPRLNVGRRTVFEALRAENIGVNVHYKPVYQLPYYEKLGYTGGLCPVAEALYETFITLPLFPKMTEQDVQDVCTAVHKVLSSFAKNISIPS
ncbi:UDP-4-amino-4,6-dideoxy-N-acetyl-beta-L-altrosamine transaminase [Paenibacillus sp. YYML68]|uniref:UDP-4-amino-4, 6-dideoxy-N-acetyl-beta-L-altrosamine transaminase n=1 Tax=Paenibacillus sp. YYML68 TaxID=2909250 RepID=UPI00249306F8|nr:UDP-4-amino-4,6-dideoxy-N-acetyl-beta-L-altrosamine transaminase [Paenibacillus sp. YYML68]